MENFIDDNTVFILDSYGLIFREYYAFFSRPLTDSKGQNVSAIFGFFRNLSIIFKTYKPKYFVAAMDSRTPTFRHQMYDKYKATRAKTPEDLKAQFPIIEECLKTLGIKPLRVDGFEADDVVATIAKQCDRQNRHCLILSADKDLQQLAGKNIHILKPDKTKTWVEVDENGVASEWGVQPKKILDLLSLTGDSADNVPGVQGVGPKTAVKLIAEYETLENVLANADKIKGSLGEKLRTSKDEALLSKKLITLDENIPLNKSEPLLENEDLFKNFCTENLNFGDFAKEMTKRELPALAKTYSELKNSGGGSLPRAPAEPSSAAPSAGHIPATPLLKKNQGKYNLCTDLKSLEDFVTQAINSKIVAFDTETDSLNTLEANLVGFSLSYKEGSGIYVPLIVNEDPLFMRQLISKKDAFDQLKRLFDSNITIAMHNAKFDLEVLYSNGLDIINLENANSSYKLFDTMIAAWLLEPDRISKNPYSLETLSEQILGLKGTEFEEIVEKGKTFADVKLEDAANYAAEDSDFTLKLCNYYQNALKKESLWDLYTQVEIKVLPILAKMELEGIHLDSKVLNNYGAELKTQIQKAENEIYETVGHEFNIASPKQLSTVLFQERALPPGKKTKTGYSTDTDVLESLCALDTVPQMILDYRAKSKLLSTYVETLPKMTDTHGRIHTTFMQTGTATGRLSSKDPNLQNIPVRSEEGRKIRSAFTAPQGKILISADYAQIELVVLAHLSGDKNLCQAFMQGVDVHKSTASLIYGVSMNEVSAEMRRNAKTLNFGLMYGMGAFSLAKDLSISRSEAANFIENYFKVYSGVKDFFDRNVALAEQTGYIQTLMGRKRWIRGINSKNRMEKESAIRIAKNSPIQGSAADIVKKAMIDVSSNLNKSSTGAKLLLQVHDELILECDDDEKIIEKTIALLTEKMETTIKLNVPLRVSVEKGKSWGEFH
ncbi:DNA polymerase I [Treponema pectinovorum]|uniref:DNA polymerase I n=1 Tax=Treponema pectinovorum TaxID=164 RepID=UPI0011C8BA13|nr:DNA polymerase I [Treponema pectinovorum]